MDIGKAIQAMKDGSTVAREHWDGQTLNYLEPGANSKMTEPYIYKTSTSGNATPWCAPHGDLLATDWREV